MNTQFTERITTELAEIEAAGLSKKERIITSEQGAEIVVNGKTVLNFCANNYLGLSSHPKVIEAAHKAIDSHGYGMSSVRFICGTQDIHKELETKIAQFLGTEDAILYAAAFDANGGVFEPLIALAGADFEHDADTAGFFGVGVLAVRFVERFKLVLDLKLSVFPVFYA